MKVVHAITGLGVGGAENMLHQVVPELNDEDHTHQIISLTDDDEIGKEIEAEGVDVQYLGLRRDMLNLSAVAWRFYKALRRIEPDVLYCYLIHTNIFGRIMGRLAGVETVICSIRNKHIDRWFLNWVDRMTSGLVDMYVPNSEATVPFVRDHQGIPEEKIRVVPNGINVDEFDIDVDTEAKRDSLGVDHESFLLGCVAKLQPQKDHKTLLRAFSDFEDGKNTDLLLLGDGPLRDDLEGLARDLDITESVHFLGWRDDVKELLQTIDVFILPSRHEGMSNALLEAMASATCCIASDIPENKVVLGKTGRTFNCGSASKLNGQIQRVYEEKSLKRRTGRKCKNRAHRFDWKTTISKYKSLLSEVE